MDDASLSPGFFVITGETRPGFCLGKRPTCFYIPFRLDSLPPGPPSSETRAYAPREISPRTARERELCARASHPDWVYLAALALADTGAFWLGSSDAIKNTPSIPVRLTGPAMIGLAWGATVGGAWLALPKCSPTWIGEPPPEGDVHESWPVALSLALLAGVTAPIVNGIAIGWNLPPDWSTLEREVHVGVAGLMGFTGALLPYLFPPQTYAAAREIERIRVGLDGRGGVTAIYAAPF